MWQDISNEINETLGQSYGVPDEIDESELMGELEALEVRALAWRATGIHCQLRRLDVLARECLNQL